MAIVNRRMKVMHIISGDLWAGAEVQAYTLLKELRTECELHVVLMNPGELADRLKTLEIPVTLLDEARMNAVKILLGLRNIMLSFRPDVVHTHRQKENILGAIANIVSVNAVSVRTSHGASEFAAKGIRRLQVFVDKMVGRYHQKAIIAVSDDLARKLKSKFQASKIYVIPNGIDVGSLEQAVKNKEPPFPVENVVNIGIIGRLEPVKRIDIFLQVAALLSKRNLSLPLQFHVIGDGNLRQELETSCDEMGLEGRVIFHGHRRDIAPYIYSLDILLMCSDHEGTPMTALEAVALGTHLIAHSVGGLKEILSGHPQLLVDSQVPEAYAKKIEDSLPFVKEKQQRLLSQYRSSCNSKRVRELYQSLLHCQQII